MGASKQCRACGKVSLVELCVDDPCVFDLCQACGKVQNKRKIYGNKTFRRRGFEIPAGLLAQYRETFCGQGRFVRVQRQK